MVGWLGVLSLACVVCTLVCKFYYTDSAHKCTLCPDSARRAIDDVATLVRESVRPLLGGPRFKSRGPSSSEDTCVPMQLPGRHWRCCELGGVCLSNSAVGTTERRAAGDKAAVQSILKLRLTVQLHSRQCKPTVALQCGLFFFVAPWQLRLFACL